jgi:predicted XRE-type DNA-binding protein
MTPPESVRAVACVVPWSGAWPGPGRRGLTQRSTRTQSRRRSRLTQGSGNVFADLGFDPQEAQNLLLRSQTMMVITQWFEDSGLTQAAAAKTMGLTQPRLNQLLKGKIGEFNLDALVNLATCAGMRVGLTLRPMAGVRAKAAKVAKVVQAGQRQTA